MKRKHDKTNKEDNVSKLNNDTWSHVLLLFDDYPIIDHNYSFEHNNTDIYHGSRITVVNTKTKIKSVKSIMTLVLVCKTFKKIIEGKYLLEKWKHVFVYNFNVLIGNNIIINQIYTTKDHLIREIIILNEIISNKKDILLKLTSNPPYIGCYEKKHEKYGYYNGIWFTKFIEKPHMKRYKNNIRKINDEYDKYIEKIIKCIQMCR